MTSYLPSTIGSNRNWRISRTFYFKKFWSWKLVLKYSKLSDIKRVSSYMMASTPYCSSLRKIENNRMTVQTIEIMIFSIWMPTSPPKKISQAFWFSSNLTGIWPQKGFFINTTIHKKPIFPKVCLLPPWPLTRMRQID